MRLNENNESSLVLARIVSNIFLPPLFTVTSFILIALNYENSQFHKLIVIFSGLIFGNLIPISLFIFLLKRKKIINIDAEIKEERTAPLIINIFLFVFALIICFFAGVSNYSLSLWSAYLLNTILLTVINLNWKISAHMMGIGGGLAVFYFHFGFTSVLFFPFVILLGWARIKLKCHSFYQVAAGFLVSFTVTYFVIKNLPGYL